MKAGFTIIEALVIIWIIAILSGIIFLNRRTASEKSKVVTAKKTVAKLATAVASLYGDTKLYPCGYGAKAMEAGNSLPAVVLDNSKGAGLRDANKAVTVPNPYGFSVEPSGSDTCDSREYYNWQGPYIDSLGKDPWGRDYLLDFNYLGPPYDNVQIAILSYGPDGDKNTCDDVYKSLYARPPKDDAETGNLENLKNGNGSCKGKNKVD